LVPEHIRAEASFRKGTGCETCSHTGFSGRVSVTEMLTVGENLRNAILEKLPTRRLQEIAQADGLQTLWQKGLRRVAYGETTLEEILRVIGMEGF
jgi:type II secretory ATPase GspE/PulE/Tfp pilus assembly ATPase PilB-like protein